MKETNKFQKGYGGPPKFLYLSFVGRSAFNVESHCFNAYSKMKQWLL